jgi:hypothetical protein
VIPLGARVPDGPKESARRTKKAAPRETRCNVDVGRGGKKVASYGVVALGDDALHFHTGRTGKRGTDFSLIVEYDGIHKIVADEPAGLLTLSLEEEPHELVLHLGRMTGDWKKMLEDRPEPFDELGVQPGSQVGLVGVDDDELNAYLTGRVRGFAGDNPTGTDLDYLFVGAEHPRDLRPLKAYAERVRQPGGVIWLLGALLPKDVVAPARDAGLVPGETIEVAGRLTARRLTRA